VLTPRFGGTLPGGTRVRFVHYPVSRRTPLETFFTNALFSRLWSEREIVQRRPDIVILSSYDVAFAHYVAFRHKIPSMYIYHSSFYSPAVDRIGRKPWPLSAAHGPLERFLIRVERVVFEHASGIVAVSPFSRKQVEARLGRPVERLRVIPTGVDTARFRPGDRAIARTHWQVEPEQLMLATVGRLAPVKRYDRAIDVLHILRDRGHDAILVVAGAGPEEARLRRYAASKVHRDAIRFAGFVDGAHLVDLYRAADVVINTSEFENWSLGLLEALASGAVVVATPRGSSPDMLLPIDPAMVAAGSEPIDLADAIDALIATGRLDELRETASTHISTRFSWDRTVSELENFAGELVRTTTRLPQE
jgi:glycosyltransferase involved in cell wall biosynthesis